MVVCDDTGALGVIWLNGSVDLTFLAMLAMSESTFEDPKATQGVRQMGKLG